MTPEDVRHGTNAGYVAHYGDGERPCQDCMAGANAYKREIYRLRAYGRWQPLVDAEPVRKHIRYLMDNGVGITGIARAAGVGEETIGRVLYAKGKTAPKKRIRPASADAILALTPDDGIFVPAVGATRRLRALAAIGWTSYEIADRLGTCQGNAALRRIYTGTERVRRETHEKIAALYDELSMIPGTSLSARMRAEKKRWIPPLAWDDETIDDPAAEPQGIPGRRDREHIDPNSVDPMNVDRVLAGDWRLKCTRAEKEAVTGRWLAGGGTLNQLAKQTGWNANRYGKAAARGSLWKTVEAIRSGSGDPECCRVRSIKVASASGELRAEVRRIGDHDSVTARQAASVERLRASLAVAERLSQEHARSHREEGAA